MINIYQNVVNPDNLNSDMGLHPFMTMLGVPGMNSKTLARQIYVCLLNTSSFIFPSASIFMSLKVGENVV